MKTTKWILPCALAVSMTTAAIWAQKTVAVPDCTSRPSAELDMLVDLAEMDLLADMLESFLPEGESADSNSIDDSQMPGNGLASMPGMGFDIYGGGFGMGNMGSGFPIMADFSGMAGFCNMGGFGGYPITGGFGGMGGYCGF